MRTQASLVPNPNCENRRIKTITQHMQDKDSTRFYCKNEIKT